MLFAIINYTFAFFANFLIRLTIMSLSSHSSISNLTTSRPCPTRYCQLLSSDIGPFLLLDQIFKLATTLVFPLPFDNYSGALCLGPSCQSAPGSQIRPLSLHVSPLLLFLPLSPRQAVPMYTQPSSTIRLALLAGIRPSGRNSNGFDCGCRFGRLTCPSGVGQAGCNSSANSKKLSFETAELKFSDRKLGYISTTRTR